jgi:Fe2+ transport system protein FeoA
VARKNSGKPAKPVDNKSERAHTKAVLQLSGNNELAAPAATLVDLDRGDAAILDRIELPGEDARRLMELGFLPGTRITAGLSAPGGDPRVFQVDGSEVALRRETARKLKVRPSNKPRN